MRYILCGLTACVSLFLLDPPALAQEEANHRKPKDDAELRYWLENMVWHHRFTDAEITAATGLKTSEIEAALKKFDIRAATKPRRAADAPLLVVPYPGGRHPRIGFLEGAIRPQRETKVSVFTPWDDASYVVVDVPEAIFTNLGLTYLAHTHVPTIWEKEKVELEKLEWNRRADGTLDIERRLPNGIDFGVKVVPTRTEVRMELWLKNGTKQKLTDMRVQNCVLLKGAKGFEAQSNDNKVFASPFAAAKSADGKRWVITAWEPIQRAWGNAKCPCLHSDPRIPDCAPGETQRLHGWLSFYEGDDIQAEFRRIDKTGWRAANTPLKIHLIAGGEYNPVPSMTQLKKHLEANYRVECSTSFYEGTGSPSKLENLDPLKAADLLILFARRMNLREEQMKLIRAHWEAGKPIVGIRTACHAFQKADNEIIDRKLFGGHYAVGPSSNGGFKTAIAKGRDEHPVLKGVGELKAAKYAYGNGDLAESVTVLHIVGRIKDRDFPVTWVNTHKGGRYFYTSLGSPEDFQQEGMLRLLSNAAFWTAQREPEKMKRVP